MRILCAILLTLLLSMIAILDYIKNRDILSPLVFYAFLTFMRYVPGILLLEKHMGVTIDINLIYNLTLIQTISILFTVLGCILVRLTKDKYKSYCVTYSSSISLKKCGIIVYIIGSFFAFWFIKRIGGVNFILTGIKGIHAGNGNSYIRAGVFLMVVGMCLLLKGRKDEGKKCIDFIFILLFLGYALVFAIQTSRSPVLEAIMIIAIVYHYCINKIEFIRLFSIKYVFLVFICVAFLLIMPIFRSENGFELNNKSLEKLQMEADNTLISTVEELSYVSRDGFIYEYANFDNFWLGSNIINLLCAPIPSILIDWKPPVDDGLYLANLVKGYDVRPPEKDLPWYNSFPMSTPGGCYINFGILGVIFGSLFVGFMYGKMYKRIIQTDYDVVEIIIYQNIIYQFELTCLSIVQTIMPVLLTLFITKIVCGRKLKKEVFF